MPDTIGEVLAQNLVRARKRLGISLSELARRSGIGKATLSQLESGAGNPTVETVFALARELGATVGELFRTPTAREVLVVRAAEQEPLRGAAIELRLLRHEGAGVDGFDVYSQRVRPGVAQGSGGHQGVEQTVVVVGRLAVEIGEERFGLGPGDSIEFDARAPHSYRAEDGDVESVLVLTTGPRPDHRIAPAAALPAGHAEALPAPRDRP